MRGAGLHRFFIGARDPHAMGRAPILIVEDDAKTAGLIRLYLEHEGWTVEIAGDGRTALERARATPPLLVVLDAMLPHVDGFEVCRQLRAESDVPVILVTARTGEEDRLAGLDLGADDYIAKPFSPRELVARVRAVLRRSTPAEPDGPPLERGDLRLDPRRRETWVRGRPVTLTPREFQLLHALMRAPGRAFTRGELVERALGQDFAGLERTVDVHVKNLRRKIEADPGHPRFIVTVPGVGYRLGGDA
jgi:DNA-binding response OmpR family regulator